MNRRRTNIVVAALAVLLLACLVVLLVGCTPRFYPYSHPPLEEMPRP